MTKSYTVKVQRGTADAPTLQDIAEAGAMLALALKACTEPHQRRAIIEFVSNAADHAAHENRPGAEAVLIALHGAIAAGRQ
jgi:hypothetical protein